MEVKLFCQTCGTQLVPNPTMIDVVKDLVIQDKSLRQCVIDYLKEKFGSIRTSHAQKELNDFLSYIGIKEID